MSTMNTREMFGDEYRLTIVEKDVAAPPATEKMFRLALDELGLKGNFSFHPKGHLPQAPADAKPRMSAVLGGNEILISMRWGTREKDSVSGSLFVPNSSRPAEVQPRLVKVLGNLNADGWSELTLNGSVKPPAQSSAIVIPAFVSAEQKADVMPPYDKEKEKKIAEDLFKKADENAIINIGRIRDYVHRYHPDPHNRNIVSDTIARLEDHDVLRRVQVMEGRWQFTEAYLRANGHVVIGYHPLPEVVPKTNGSCGGPPRPQPNGPQAQSPSPQAAPPSKTAEAAPPPVPPAVVVAPPSEEEVIRSRLDELKQLYDDFGRLLEERPQAVEQFEKAQRALSELDASVDAMRKKIDDAKGSLDKDDLLKLLLQRAAI